MTTNNLRTLAECLELDFILKDDLKRWARDLRAHARAIDESILRAVEAGPEVKR